MNNIFEQFHTYKEIRQQPEMWCKEFGSILSRKDEIRDFVKRYLDDGYEIYFTGAGTSAFIGDALSFVFTDSAFSSCRSVPTTDIVTNYKALFPPHRKVLLISFARSGNSPESIAAVNIANKVAAAVAHIFITCNSTGALARMASEDPGRTLLILLPPETNDLSLAMTSSFSTMAMACMMISRITEIDGEAEYVKNASEITADLMDRYEETIQRLSEVNFSRAVFLGSGPLKGIAEESHLKLQELTDGAVVCKFDSFLGFRHGPKAVIKNDSMLVYLLSDDPYIRQYEIDLIRQINMNNKVAAQVLVSLEPVSIDGVSFDAELILNRDGRKPGIYRYIPYIVFAQMLGCFKSVGLGLSPDSPSKSGNIHRVVEGVKIYDI